jgi:choline transport protein
MSYNTPHKSEYTSETIDISSSSSKSPNNELIDSSSDIFGSLVADKTDMSRMGKKQEMHRVFHQVSLLSFTAILMASWEWMLLANTQGLTDGGRAGLFWSYIWVFVGFGLTVASLAEMASMAPTCAGQYHWVSEFAPERWQAQLSYVTGMTRVQLVCQHG